MNDLFLLIEAAGTDKPRVMGIAYSGTKMSLPGWRHPVVVDLSGMEIPEQVPLLANHENRTGSRVGMINARVEDGCLVIEGEILSSSGQASGIVEQAKAGGDWQLSIGAEVKDAELIAKGKNRIINGRSHEGPFYHVKASVLREVSVVAVGADATTRMKVAASFTLKGDIAMEFNAWLKGKGLKEADLSLDRLAALRAEFDKENAPPANDDETKVIPAPQKAEAPSPKKPSPPEPKVDVAEQAKAEAQRAVQAERDRVSAIQGICSGEYPHIEREAISAGWDAERTSQKVLAAIRENRPDVNLNTAPSTSANTQKSLEAALCLRMGIPEESLVASYGEQVMETAHQDRNISMQELIAECARLEGVSVPRTFGNDTIRAGFSTVSLPGILNNVANKALLKAFQSQAIIATSLCSEGELNDFKESERYRLTDVGDLEPVAADGELKHGGLKEEKATNQLDTFGKTFALTRKMIINDDLGAFMKVPEGMGARAARKVDQLFFMRLMSNPSGLFSAAHKNFKDGVDTALSGESLTQAIQMFLDQVDADGQPINVSPKFLLVPTPLKMTARELLNSVTFFATGTNNKTRIPTYNALADEDLTVVTSPYLSNANYSGASQKSWFLFADPSVVDTFEIGYLKGRRTPTVERGDTDFNTLGMQFRVYFDLGVREQDHRGMIKFAGE